MSENNQPEPEVFGNNMSTQEIEGLLKKWKTSEYKNVFENDPESDTDSDTETKKEKPLKTKWTEGPIEILPDGSFSTPMFLHLKLPNIQMENPVECQDKPKE